MTKSYGKKDKYSVKCEPFYDMRTAIWKGSMKYASDFILLPDRDVIFCNGKENAEALVRYLNSNNVKVLKVQSI